MTRVRRRLARDRRDQETTDAQRKYWAWRRASLLRLAAAPPGHPDHAAALAERIRLRQYLNREWDRLRGSGLSPEDARRELQRVPSWARP